jgi:hypothetical protein
MTSYEIIMINLKVLALVVTLVIALVTASKK